MRPSDSTAKWVSPRSMPITGPASGRAPGPVSTTKLAKYRPAESLITVTLDGSDGSGRDHRTGTSPILGRRSFPLGSTLNRALAVNRIACRWSLRDLNRGGPIFGPFRFPVTEAKKFRYAVFRSARDCWSTTAETSPSQARSGVALAAVSRADSSPVGEVRLPGRVRLLPGAQPVVEHHPRAAERPRQRLPLAGAG